MESIVFIEPNKIGSEPFTTSDVIARFARVSHHAVQQTTAKYEADFNELGVIAFEMRKPEKGSAGGRPETIYHYNEPQATLLITYLKNTAPVRAFKKELVKQFYSMRAELTRRQLCREQLKPIRRELTDVVKEKDGHPWAYKNYTDLAYKSVLGKNAAQLRKDRGAPKKAKAIDYMTAEEIERVTKKQSQISVLCDMGMCYEQVKELVLNHKVLGMVA